MKGAAPDSPLVAALAYRKRGWSVIAMQARGKRPIVPWLRYESEFASVATVRGWFSRWPQANVGIVTGALSGLIVLDVDPRHGGDESLRQIESTAGALPVTVEARSGGGGRHVYFAHPGVRVPNRIGLRSGLDVRGDGGCIVAPPSVHARPPTAG